MSGSNSASHLNAHSREEIARWLRKYPPERKHSALLAALRVAQHQNGGWLSRELMDEVADCLDLPPIAVYESATFYSMFETRPVGRCSISVCTNLSCFLLGAEEILAHLERRLGVREGESTADGRYYLKREEECLAACCGAPMMMVDHEYYERLTPERVDEVLDELERAPPVASPEAGDEAVTEQDS